ncbi:uncharacterized protein LOC118503077 [Anopheles stephensi]|uniref:uncharacterized protein LOC118503077 n=1 Tax=Anopheles stephensi TaxID=30069 RepID=UPI001658768B|nr:uncharacterized protein LOC118503077 [Anopheles stephensi]
MCCRTGRLLLLLFGLSCVIAQNNGQGSRLTCGRRRVKSVYLIHNGIDAKAGHWPWHAAIFHRKQGKSEYACGGVIIDESTILTAAHCIYTTSGKIPLDRIVVTVGQIDLKDENEFTQKHNLHETIVHPKYGPASIINDIALLKLSTNITMTKYVQPVCLWTMDSNQEMIAGRNGTIVGFGLNEHDEVSKQLKQALIGVVDALTCIASDRSVFGTHLTSDMYCAKGQTGVSACNGDSGGGMFFEVGGKWFVRGLVSFTPLRGNTGLCDPLKYTAYTDVAKHFEWIVKYVDPRVLSFESDVLEIDYEEKLRLFNFETCGVPSSALLGDGNGWTGLPWLGFVIFSPGSDSAPNRRCTVTLISDWYAIGPAHCFDNDGIERWILLGGDSESSTTNCSNDRNGNAVCSYPTQTLQIERIITHPKYDSNSLGDNIVLIELLSAANTTLPNVRPICISATPELRTTQMVNLSVASFSSQASSYRSEAVSLVNTDYCKTQYADLGFTIDWKNKRFCAQIPAEESCSSLRSGAPLQELRSFGDTSRYFLRGFELFGRACATEIPPVYNNLDEYLDWILYNMRYSISDKAEPVAPAPTTSGPKQSLEKEWDALQQQPGKENLRLFNMDTCGLSTSRNENLGRVTILPWVGFFQGAENVTDESSFTKSLAVLISEWYAIVPKRSVTSNISWRLMILGKYNPDDPTNCYTSTCEITHQMVEIKNVIVPPIDHPRQMLALIELLEPANLKLPYISPICLPFMQQLQRKTPTEVTISSNKQFAIVSKKLTMIDYLNCQQRLLLATHFVTFDGDFPCAIEAEKFRQVSLPSSLGSPLQMPVRMGGRARYFLYGMDTNEENIFSDLVYGPYLFGTIEPADLDWIVENMQFKERNTSLPIETRSADRERVSLAPMPDTSKRNLFNFNTCGINTLLSESFSSYPIPWTGNVFSNATYFNVSRCSVTLISEWYAVGPAYCFGDVKEEYNILFGFSSDSTNRECAKLNTTAPCKLPEQRIPVEKIIVHPQYDRPSYSNDIALVKLARPADTSQRNVRPICLPLLDEVRSYGLSSLVMSSTKERTSDFTVTPIENRYLHRDECQQRWNGLAVSFTVDTMKSCIITKRSSDDKCVGVFTGAALHTLQRVQSSDRHFLRGYVLILPRGCSVYYPAVYTNTEHYLSWMLENMDEPLFTSNGSADLREKLIFT